MTKRPRTTRSWIVYPPNYEPGDGYFKFNHIKKARGKAIALGVGSDLVAVIKKSRKCGWSTTSWNDEFEYRTNSKYPKWVKTL